MKFQKVYMTSRRQADNSQSGGGRVSKPDLIIPTGVGHALAEDAELTLCGRSFSSDLVYPNWPGMAPNCRECIQLAAAS